MMERVTEEAVGEEVVWREEDVEMKDEEEEDDDE